MYDKDITHHDMAHKQYSIVANYPKVKATNVTQIISKGTKNKQSHFAQDY